ncbi:hypothetical protein ACFYO1_25045 [Nocardia sp. NPDC006044]|uniref:hypothetical protein n=1 Tax=Nocardia sp. NPDC006044 TaxID=3364306 RepID=UPI0036AC1BFB
MSRSAIEIRCHPALAWRATETVSRGYQLFATAHVGAMLGDYFALPGLASGSARHLASA